MKKKSTAAIGMAVCFMMMTAGAAWSENRAAIPPNGTLTDTITGLVWLQNANCFGMQDWWQATSSAANLKSDMCGLTDGSTAGQWRLPTKDELLIRAGNKQGFNNVQAYDYWSSSSYVNGNSRAWVVVMVYGNSYYVYKVNFNYVWPVRAGK